MTFDVRAAVTPRQLATSLRRDLKDPRYLAEIEQSRDDLFAGRHRHWSEILDQEPADDKLVRA